MKNLFTLLSHLRGSMGNLQSSDVSHDRRLTVGSPSGLDAKWKQNPFMRFAAVLTFILSIGVGNAWGAIANPYSFTFSNGDLNTSSTSFTKGEVAWSLSATENSWNGTSGKYGYIFGSGKSPKQLTVSTSGISGTITQVTVTGRSNNSGKTATVSVTVGSTDFSTTDDSWDNGNNQTLTFTGSASGEISVHIEPSDCGHSLLGISVTYSATPAVAYTVTYNAGTGSCKASEKEASAGAGVTLPTPTHSCYSEGWSFAGWTTGALVSSETDETPDPLYAGGSTYKPSNDITLYAVYQKGDGLYHLVTTLPTGEDIPGYYMIVNTSAQKAMDAYVVSSYYLDADATGTITSNAINPENVDYFSYNHWKVTYESSKWIFYNESQSKYLYNYNATYKNLGITSTKPAGYTVTLSGGYAVFASADVSGAYIYYDSSNSRFAGNSTTKNLHLYKLEEATYYSNPTCCTALGTINGSVSLSHFCI